MICLVNRRLLSSDAWGRRVYSLPVNSSHDLDQRQLCLYSLLLEWILSLNTYRVEDIVIYISRLLLS